MRFNKTQTPTVMVAKTWKDTAKALLLKVYLILTVLGITAGASFYAGTQFVHADAAPVVVTNQSK